MSIYGKSTGKGRGKGKGKGPCVPIREDGVNYDHDYAEDPFYEPTDTTDPGSFSQAMRAMDRMAAISQRLSLKPWKKKKKKQHKKQDNSWVNWLPTSLFGGKAKDVDSSSSAMPEEQLDSEQAPVRIQTTVSTQMVPNTRSSTKNLRKCSGKSFLFASGIGGPKKGEGLHSADDSYPNPSPSPRPHSRTTSDTVSEATTATPGPRAASRSPSTGASTPSTKGREQLLKSASTRSPSERHASREEALPRSPVVSGTSRKVGLAQSGKSAMNRSLPSSSPCGPGVNTKTPAFGRVQSEGKLRVGGQGGDRSPKTQTSKPTQRRAPSPSQAMQKIATDRPVQGVTAVQSTNGKGNFKGQKTASPVAKGIMF